VREGTRFVPDEVGLVFDSLNAAERAAAETAAEIGRELLPKDDAREITVEVRNEHGQQVLTVAVAMTVRCMNPAPA
jgi:hypothetical protein